MPDKHSDNNKPEISEELIRKYLAGELDDRAMHALERQALDDPFLAEALEGYAIHEPDQSAHLADLQQRLEGRLEQSKRGKVRLLYYRWASAAAILVILGLSFLWINHQQSAEQKRDIAKVEAARANAAYKASDSATIAPEAAGKAQLPAAETLIAKADAPAADKKPAAPASTPEKASKDATAPPEARLEEEKAAAPALASAEAIAQMERADSEGAKKETAYDIAANSTRARQQKMTVKQVAPVASGYNMRPRAAMLAKAPRIVVLGSSTAEGVGPKSPDSTWVTLFRHYLQAKQPQATVVNLAVGGYTSYKILPASAEVPFNKPDTDPEHNIDKALSLNPDMIIINMPTNDIIAGYSVEEFRRNLAMVTDIIRQHHIRFYITTTQPRNTIATYRRKLEEMRDIIIRNYPDAYIDCWDGLSTADGNILPQYDSGDGIHLNGLGHQIMFDRIKERVTFP